VAGQAQADGLALHAREPHYSARLLIGCPDRPGIVAAVSGFLFELGANIVSSHQYSSDPSGGRFFLRTEFFLPDDRDRAELVSRFQHEVAEGFQMEWEIRWWGERRRIAILVSRHEHCLLDLLWRRRRGELDAEIVTVISNHPDLEPDVTSMGIDFACVPVLAGHKDEAEKQMLELLRGRAELLVLARYMQILSGRFLEQVGMPAINIHHSFLPAFVGARPYHQAQQRGVKLIGATAHYATADLDEGPIIAQDVTPVSHRDAVADLVRKGRDLETVVLARAVRAHLEHRTLVYGNKTIVFG
jgi:formyltetrahydrofolate deformylase